MLLQSALLFLAPSITTSIPPQQEDRRTLVRQQYETLAARRDAEALASLWVENRDLILQTIDADLEGGLAVWEQSPAAPEQERIRALHDRAMFAAMVASDATGAPIYADYAASFIGWNDEDRRNFRAGQAIYARALDELKAGDHDAAIGSAQEARERAVSLGDWWGVAMGYAAEARALEAGDHLVEALAAHGVARLLYNELGLYRTEYQHLRSVAELSRTLKRFSRAHAALQQALELARKIGETGEIGALLRARAEVERALGRAEQAAATEAEVKALEGEK